MTKLGSDGVLVRIITAEPTMRNDKGELIVKRPYQYSVEDLTPAQVTSGPQELGGPLLKGRRRN